MRVLKALSHKQIRRLWAGQLFSCMGDEVYHIAMVWYAASLVGFNAGYVSAIHAASMFVFSLIGGIFVDHRDHRRVMLAADVIRGLVVLSLPLIGSFYTLNLWILIPAAILVASLNAVFTPAMNALLPQLVDDRPTLQAANGLMETTSRLARVAGPGLIGLVGKFIPLIHYFTIDAISFFISAWSIRGIQADSATAGTPRPRLSFKDNMLAGHRLVWSQPIVSFVLFTGAVAGAAWLFILPLGITLLVRDRLPADVSAVGWLISAYGFGNVVSNLSLIQITIHRPERWMFAGRMVAGVGFALLCLSQNLHQMMIACAIAALGGPMTDLAYVNLVQTHFRGVDVARVFRYSLAIGHGCLLLVLVSSPSLFKLSSVTTVIASGAVLIFLLGAVGFLRPSKSV